MGAGQGRPHHPKSRVAGHTPLTSLRSFAPLSLCERGDGSRESRRFIVRNAHPEINTSWARRRWDPEGAYTLLTDIANREADSSADSE